MKKGKAKTPKSQAKSMVMIPLYQSRVQRDVKSSYSRKEKHRQKPSSEGFLLPAAA